MSSKILFYFLCWKLVVANLRQDIEFGLHNVNQTNLLRARRYLVFPEGSSFQLVYDLAYPSVDYVGFFVYGNTAALAWELPSTPAFLDKKFGKKEEPTTTMLPELEHPEYEDHHDWQRNDIQKVYRQPVSSYYYNSPQNGYNANYQRRYYAPIDRQTYHNIHRITRRELYTKIESVFSTFTENARTCLLKLICDVNNSSTRKGTLWEELLKTVFKARPDDSDEEIDHYDVATKSSTTNCDDLYPGCEGNILTKLLESTFRKNKTRTAR